MCVVEIAVINGVETCVMNMSSQHNQSLARSRTTSRRKSVTENTCTLQERKLRCAVPHSLSANKFFDLISRS